MKANKLEVIGVSMIFFFVSSRACLEQSAFNYAKKGVSF